MEKETWHTYKKLAGTSLPIERLAASVNGVFKLKKKRTVQRWLKLIVGSLMRRRAEKE
jgi:hypothetical protein